MELLPPELVIAILVNVPVPDILRVAQVCHYFAAVTTDASLWSQKAWLDFGFPVSLFHQTEVSPRHRYRQIMYYLINPNDSLTSAAEQGHLELVKFLQPKCPRDTIYWAIREAIWEGHRDVVNYLLPYTSWCGYNDFMCQAAKYNRLTIIHDLVALGATNFNGALRRAAKRGHFDIVKYCLDHGATDVNHGLTSAAIGGHREIVIYFLDAGATYWDEALSNAAGRGHSDLVKFLLSQWNYGIHALDWALQSAALSGYLDLVKYMISQGASDLDSALIWAATGGQLNVIRYLVDRGATTIDRALTAASYKQHLDVIEYLRSILE